MKVAAIHQPGYLPYLGYFYKMARADVFIHLDNTQFANGGFQNRNRVKTSTGEVMMTVPVAYDFGDALNQVKICEARDWRRKHLRTLEMNYHKAPFFDRYFPAFKRLLEAKYKALAYMNIAINEWIADEFHIRPKIMNASQFPLDSRKESLVIDLCKAVGADTYLSGRGAQIYQHPQHFEDNGLRLIYAEDVCWPYNQLYKDFLPYMSSLDFLFNEGDRFRPWLAAGGALQDG